jgi:hypothetical protein
METGRAMSLNLWPVALAAALLLWFAEPLVFWLQPPWRELRLADLADRMVLRGSLLCLYCLYGLAKAKLFCLRRFKFFWRYRLAAQLLLSECGIFYYQLRMELLKCDFFMAWHRAAVKHAAWRASSAITCRECIVPIGRAGFASMTKSAGMGRQSQVEDLAGVDFFVQHEVNQIRRQEATHWRAATMKMDMGEDPPK